MRLLNEFQKVERTILVGHAERLENDVEHCYQLALVAWYAVEAYRLPLNADKVIKYALLHDLVEVYAGDTYIFDKDPAVHQSKVQREHEALERIKQELPEFLQMTSIITEYERREDEESNFIYALDKVIAPLNIYLQGGRTWKKYQVTFDQLMENKSPKVKAHPEVERYFLQLKEILEKEQDQSFHKEDIDK